MTVNDVCLIAVGVIFNGMTFGLGLFIGASMGARKID